MVSGLMPLKQTLERRLVFVHGKGGVGKTAISLACANALAHRGLRTIWVTFEEPTREQGHEMNLSLNLYHLNCETHRAFEQYVDTHLPLGAFARIFTGNGFIRYLVKAAPGFRELILVGKAWDLTHHYDHVIVDMPSTGYAIAMFQAVRNFHKLFSGGRVRQNTEKVLHTFEDPLTCAHLIVALPEETPLRESVDLAHALRELFPGNPPSYLVNRVFPDSLREPASLAASFIHSRVALEAQNLKIWDELSISYERMERVPDCTRPGDSPDLKSDSAPALKGTNPAVVGLLTRAVSKLLDEDTKQRGTH